MKFFYRYRKATSLVSLVGLVVGMAVAPATAEYDPRIGRFLQRDQHGTGVVLQPSLPYHAANPTVTVSMAYELQFADGMNFYQFVRSNPITGRDPSGLFAYMDMTTATGLQATLAGLYGDVSASLVDSMKGIALLQNERYAVLDSALGFAVDVDSEWAGIDQMLAAWDTLQSVTTGLTVTYLGVRAGWGAIKLGKAAWKRYALRAGGRQRLLSTLESGTKTRRLSGFGIRGPGSWRRVREAMSPRAAAYQRQISGRAADQIYEVNGVRFDGFRAGTLLEAKGPGYASFVDDAGDFRGWFGGDRRLVKQAVHQSRAAQGFPVEWHVAEQKFARALRKLFTHEGINIAVVHSPASGP
jgi:hypothetical protein